MNKLVCVFCFFMVTAANAQTPATVSLNPTTLEIVEGTTGSLTLLRTAGGSSPLTVTLTFDGDDDLWNVVTSDFSFTFKEDEERVKNVVISSKDNDVVNLAPISNTLSIDTSTSYTKKESEATATITIIDDDIVSSMLR